MKIFIKTLAIGLSVVLLSCSDRSAQTPIIPVPEISYDMTDRIIINDELKQTIPADIYSNYNGNYYKVSGQSAEYPGYVEIIQFGKNPYQTIASSEPTSLLRGSFRVLEDDIVLTIMDSTQVEKGFETVLTLTFKNTSPETLQRNYSPESDNVFFEYGQGLGRLEGGYQATMSLPHKIEKGVIELAYDNETQTISGAIKSLEFPFDTYVPYYFPEFAPNPTRIGYDLILEAGGSTRTFNIEFKYLRRRG